MEAALSTLFFLGACLACIGFGLVCAWMITHPEVAEPFDWPKFREPSDAMVFDFVYSLALGLLWLIFPAMMEALGVAFLLYVVYRMASARGR